MPPSDEPVVLSSPDALKALANPLRQRILQRLALSGPATSTALARALGVTSGGTSYNLRVLAEHGFVEEVRERAHGRERWWRAVRRDLRLPPSSQQDAQAQEVVGEIVRLWYTADLEMLDRYLRDRPASDEWADLPPYSRGAILVTPAEYAQFFEEYIALIRRYQRAPQEAAPEARRVLARLLAHPVPQPSTAGEEVGQ